MKIKDEDFTDLLAGYEVGGVDDKDKAIVQLVRANLLQRQAEESIQISDEELAAEDAKIPAILAAAYSEPSAKGTNHGTGATGNVIPAANRFRRYSAPVALAASAALVAVLLLQTQQYPDVSDGFDAYLKTQNQEFITKAFGPAQLTYKTAEPTKSYQSLKQFLANEEIPYSFKKSKQGWTAEFVVSVEQLTKVNLKLEEFGLSVAMPGHVIVEIVEK